MILKVTWNFGSNVTDQEAAVIICAGFSQRSSQQPK